MFESKAFACPYHNCGRTFQKPLMLTDYSKLPRETYYACPHCLSQLDVTLDNEENIPKLSTKDSQKEELTKPPECPYHLGYLKNLPKGSSVPDKCLVCPNLMQCSA